MPITGPADPVSRAEWARLRRRAAAEHHPDRGGDTEAYLSAIAAIDRAFGIADASAGMPGRPSPSSSEVVVRRTWRGSRMRVARRGRRLVRTLRKRLPRASRGAAHTTEL